MSQALKSTASSSTVVQPATLTTSAITTSTTTTSATTDTTTPTKKPDDFDAGTTMGLAQMYCFLGTFISHLILFISGMPGTSTRLKTHVYWARQYFTFAATEAGPDNAGATTLVRFVGMASTCVTNRGKAAATAAIAAGEMGSAGLTCTYNIQANELALVSFLCTLAALLTMVFLAAGTAQGLQTTFLILFMAASFINICLSCGLLSMTLHTRAPTAGFPSDAATTELFGASGAAVTLAAVGLVCAVMPWILLAVFQIGENKGYWGDETKYADGTPRPKNTGEGHLYDSLSQQEMDIGMLDFDDDDDEYPVQASSSAGQGHKGPAKTAKELKQEEDDRAYELSLLEVGSSRRRSEDSIKTLVE